MEPLERITDKHQRTWGVVSHLKVSDHISYYIYRGYTTGQAHAAAEQPANTSRAQVGSCPNLSPCKKGVDNRNLLRSASMTPSSVMGL